MTLSNKTPLEKYLQLEELEVQNWEQTHDDPPTNSDPVAKAHFDAFMQKHNWSRAELDAAMQR